MQRNDRGLPYLDPELLNVLFDHVYETDLVDIANREVRDFVRMMLTLQGYNYRYRQAQGAELRPLFDTTVGSVGADLDATGLWYALGLAIMELYRISTHDLRSLLSQVTVRK